MCLLSITENGECPAVLGHSSDTEPQPWHRAHLVLPTGLIPKDYRSLKTQYLQVRGPGSHCRARAVSGGGSLPVVWP